MSDKKTSEEAILAASVNDTSHDTLREYGRKRLHVIVCTDPEALLDFCGLTKEVVS